MGPASDVADAVLCARDVGPDDDVEWVIARGIDGQVVALVLARPT